MIDLDTWPEGQPADLPQRAPAPRCTAKPVRHLKKVSDTPALSPIRKHRRPEQLELRHRGHARVEDRVRTWKDCGLKNLPFEGYARNEAWLAVTLIAGALIAWSQLVCFTRRSRKSRAEDDPVPRASRGGAACQRGRTITLRIDETWPWSSDLGTPSNVYALRSHSPPGPGARPESAIAGRDN